MSFKKIDTLSAGGRQTGLQIYDDFSWPIVDLGSDWTGDYPIEAISKSRGIYKPQIQDYVLRALDPREAPSYNVPGDD